MSELSSQFTRDDIETLIESIGDWEMLGNHEYHVSQMIRNAAMPPEDHEAYEVMAQIKEHYRKRDRDIQASRAVRQEKAVFLKAKLMLVRKDIGISALFDMAANTDPNSAMPEPKDAEGRTTQRPPRKKAEQPAPAGDNRLELAEFFIKDLGVWEHYQKFLVEKQAEVQANNEVQPKTDVPPEATESAE